MVVFDKVSHVYSGTIVCSHAYLTRTVGTSLNAPGQYRMHNSFALTDLPEVSHTKKRYRQF